MNKIDMLKRLVEMMDSKKIKEPFLMPTDRGINIGLDKAIGIINDNIEYIEKWKKQAK